MAFDAGVQFAKTVIFAKKKLCSFFRVLLKLRRHPSTVFQSAMFMALARSKNGKSLAKCPPAQHAALAQPGLGEGVSTGATRHGEDCEPLEVQHVVGCEQAHQLCSNGVSRVR